MEKMSPTHTFHDIYDDFSWMMDSMDLQQMRYAVVLAQELNFTKAARRCFVVQSALSHQIKALETELGIELFIRTSRKVELTPAGHAFVESAQQSLALAEEAAVKAQAEAEKISGVLRIGVIPTLTAVNLPSLLAQFKREYPLVTVELVTGSSDLFAEDLRTGKLDIAFLGLIQGQKPEKVKFQQLKQSQLSAVVPAGHRLVDAGPVALADLLGESFVDFPAGSPGRHQSDVAFSRVGLDRQVDYEVNELGLLLGLVREGLAIALLCPDVVEEVPGVLCTEVVDAPTRVEFIATSRTVPRLVAEVFLGFVEGMYSEYFH